MRVLLANPPCRIDLGNDKEKFFIRAGSRWPFSVVKKKRDRLEYCPFPFYLAYTAGLLIGKGIDVQVIDAIPLNLTPEEFLEKVERLHPDVLLFETTTPTINQDMELIKKIKRKVSTVIVLAGTHASVFPREILKGNDVDYVMLREYELNFVDLISCLKSSKDIKGVKGLAYKDKKGVVVREGDIVDLDKLPFPIRDIFPSNDSPNLDLYWDGFCQFKPAIQMHTSRGCPFRCNFCLWNQVMYKNGKYRMFKASRIVDEMEYCVSKYGAKEVYFDDDSFTINKKHVLKVCNEIKKRKLEIKWSCMGDAMCTDEEMINSMAGAGCIGMKFGVESGDMKILQKIDKPIDLNKIKEVVRLCSNKGIKTHATFTFGLPGETKKTMNRTLEFAKRLDVDSLQFSIATPFPGTRFYNELARGNGFLAKEWEAYDGAGTSVASVCESDCKEIEQFYKNATGKWLRHKLMDSRWILRQMKYLQRLRKSQGNCVIFDKIRRTFELIR